MRLPVLKWLCASVLTQPSHRQQAAAGLHSDQERGVRLTSHPLQNPPPQPRGASSRQRLLLTGYTAER